MSKPRYKFTSSPVIFHVFDETWKANIYLCVNFNDQRLGAFIKTQFDLEWTPTKSGWYGKALHVENEQGPYYVIALTDWQLDPLPKHIACLVHEVFHTVEFIMGTVGMPHCDGCSEAWAYTMERITTWALDALSGKGEGTVHYPDYLQDKPLRRSKRTARRGKRDGARAS